MRADNRDIGMLHREAVESPQLEPFLTSVLVATHLGHVEEQDESVLARQISQTLAGFAVQVPHLALRPQLTDASGTGLRAARDFPARLVRRHGYGRESN